jgi:hypothetical protein
MANICIAVLKVDVLSPSTLLKASPSRIILPYYYSVRVGLKAANFEPVW